ncbi:MAG: hypothetical protein E7585_02135 [Ruminococcaceae bacterium]|nr:hypothetical protein [Oscillospiraceae bacterium]
MERSVNLKTILKNCFLSIGVQCVSLFTSFVLGFIVPKFIDELNYAYWQIYTMYATYTGVLHFGLLDGLILRYSGTDFEDLDKKKMRSQCMVVSGFNVLFAIAMSLFAYCVWDQNYFIIASLFGVAVVTKNIVLYFSYLLQIANRIKQYAKIILVQRVAYLITVVILMISGVRDFYWYCIADIIGDLFGIVVGALLNRGMSIGKLSAPKDAFSEAWRNLSVGFFLLIANFSSMFIVGGAKFIIQIRWDELTFGKASFSFSVVNIFIAFISAISVVLFPSLKRIGTEELAPLYSKIRNVISPLMFVAMLCYFPLAKILYWWLPQYAVSIQYLGVLLPMMVFTSKVGILTDNYLKAYRKERLMLLINVVAMAIGMTAFCLSAYAFNSLDAIMFSVVLTVMLRSVISEIAVTKIVGKTPYVDFLLELAMSSLFIVVARYCGLLQGFLIFLAVVAVYMFLKRKAICAVLLPILRKAFKKSRGLENGKDDCE